MLRFDGRKRHINNSYISSILTLIQFQNAVQYIPFKHQYLIT